MNVKIFIIGMMGAGKTAVGMTLSRLIGYPFLDTDQLIEAPKYFQKHSIEEFRNQESREISKINLIDGNCVVSLGGGAVLDKENRDIIKKHQTIYLRGSVETLINRIHNQDIVRPLIKFTNSGKIDELLFMDLYKLREPYYVELADFTINTNNKNILSVSIAIKNILLKHEIIN